MTRLALALTAVLLAAALPVPAGATAPAPSSTPACPDSDTSALCVQNRALARVRAQLAANLDAAQAAQKQLSDSIAENGRQQDALQGRIGTVQARIRELDAEIRQDAEQVVSLERQIVQEQREVRLLARVIYFEPTSLLMLIATSRSLREAVTGTADMVAAGSRAAAIEDRVRQQRAEVVAREADAEQARAEQAKARDELVADLDKLVDLRRQQDVKSQQLAATIARTRTEEADLDRQAADLARRIAQQLQDDQERIIAEAMQQAWAQALVWIAANPGTPGISAGHSQKYRFIWPEPAAVLTQPFGPCDLPLEPPYGGFAHFHTGIDLAEPAGSPVLAADDAVVAAVGDGQTGYGRYVVLLHRDGLVTLYGHLEQPTVKVGDSVVQGQPIGLEGSTGNSTGPHLHFELRVAGQPQDPAPLLPPAPPSAFRG